MSQSIAIHDHAHAVRDRGGRHRFLVGSILGVLIGVLAFAIVQSTVDIVRAALPSVTAVAATPMEFPARELPREWQWKPKGVEFEHMYRQHATPRLDWIRERGGR